MKKLAKLLLALVMALTVVGCSNDGPLEVDVLEIQWVPTNTATADATNGKLEAYLTNLLGMEVNVTAASDYVALIEAMKSAKVHVGIMPPATYAMSRDAGCAKAILSSTLTDYDANEKLIPDSVVTTFKAEIVMKADAPINSLKDLEGKKIGRLGTASASGYIYPVAEMIDAGVDLTKVEFTQVNDVASAMSAVARGDLDACFVFEGARYVFANAVTDKDGNPFDVWTGFKVMLSEGDIPNDAIAVHTRLEDDLVAKIKKAFTDMAADTEGQEIMKTWNHNGYVEANEADYDSIASYVEKAANEE